MKKMRINKFLSQAGGLSRRKADNAVLEGRVSVDGKIVSEKGILVDPDRDLVRLDGHLLNLDSEKLYMMFHKPVGVVTTMDDPKGRKTVADYFDFAYPRVYPVGRLDYNTSGLLIITNDGELTHHLSHPRFEVVKGYVAKVKGKPGEGKMQSLRKGILLEGKKTKPGKFEIIDRKRDKSWVRIEISEGRYREIRKMFTLIGCPVLKLKRVSFAGLELGSLPAGAWRDLKKVEMDLLKKAF